MPHRGYHYDGCSQEESEDGTGETKADDGLDEAGPAVAATGGR